MVGVGGTRDIWGAANYRGPFEIDMGAMRRGASRAQGVRAPQPRGGREYGDLGNPEDLSK